MGARPECIEDPFGEYKRGDLIRDTVIGEIHLQDLSWNGNISVSPGKLPFQVRGVLADITLSLQFVLTHQDNSASPGLLPLFSDAQLKGMLGGRSRYQPSVRWASPGGDKTCHIMFDRNFNKTFSIPYTQKSSGESLTFTHELTSTWNYSLRQGIRLRENIKAAGATDRDSALKLGGEVEKEIFKYWRLKPIADWSYTFGREGAVGAFTEQSLFPRLRIERDFPRGGRAWTEYGVNTIWGKGLTPFLLRESGFQKGVTHQVQAGLDFQLGKYVYATGNYLLRKEFPDDEIPGKNDLLQKLTAEVRAVF